VAEALLWWGKSLGELSEFAPAGERLREAAWAAEAGRDYKLAVRARVELVRIAEQQGALDQGGDYERDAEALLAGLGPDAELEALVAKGHGLLYAARGQLQEELRAEQLALDKQRAADGERESPQLATALNNLGTVYAHMGRAADSLALVRQALNIYEHTLGQHHPIYAHTLCNVADTERTLGRFAEAQRDAEKALALIEAALGPDHVYVSTAEYQLGTIAMRQNRLAEAQKHLERALWVTEKRRGPNHMTVALDAVALAETFERGNDHARALAWYRRALAVYQAGGNELLVGRTLSNIGEVQLHMNARGEAVKTLERALRIIEQHDTDAGYIGYVRFTLAQVLWPGDKTRALALARSAQKVWAGADPRDVGEGLAELDTWLKQHH
jgi:tetratricopeptide (TPR) repeat protein